MNGASTPPRAEIKLLLQQHGGFLAQRDEPGVTHTIGENLAHAHARKLRNRIVVSASWLVDSIAAGRKLDTFDYQLYRNEVHGQTRLPFGAAAAAVATDDGGAGPAVERQDERDQRPADDVHTSAASAREHRTGGLDVYDQDTEDEDSAVASPKPPGCEAPMARSASEADLAAAMKASLSDLRYTQPLPSAAAAAATSGFHEGDTEGDLYFGTELVDRAALGALPPEIRDEYVAACTTRFFFHARPEPGSPVSCRFGWASFCRTRGHVVCAKCRVRGWVWAHAIKLIRTNAGRRVFAPHQRTRSAIKHQWRNLTEIRGAEVTMEILLRESRG